MRWQDNRNLIFLIVGLALATAILVGGYLTGDGLRRARMAERSVTVRGLAERDVSADLATWTISFSEQGAELGPVQAAIQEKNRDIRAFFTRLGFKAEEVSDAGAGVSQFFDTGRGQNVVTVRQRVQLRTREVMKARAAFARQSELIREGVAIEEGSGMVYNFTRLNDVKPAMIAEATKDARRGAEQFAEDSGTRVGGIKSATQGYFSITARDGDEYEGSGRDSPFQKVRVVTTIDFYLD